MSWYLAVLIIILLLAVGSVASGFMSDSREKWLSVSTAYFAVVQISGSLNLQYIWGLTIIIVGIILLYAIGRNAYMKQNNGNIVANSYKFYLPFLIVLIHIAVTVLAMRG